MSLLLLLIWWVAFTVLFATMHGLLIPTLRLTPPGGRAKIHDIALHKVGFAVWLAPVLFAPSWLALAIALTVRFAMFDPALNLAAGDKLFYVGQTAKTDKLLQWIAGKIGISASVLSAVLRLASILILAWAMWRSIG